MRNLLVYFTEYSDEKNEAKTIGLFQEWLKEVKNDFKLDLLEGLVRAWVEALSNSDVLDEKKHGKIIESWFKAIGEKALL